MRRHDAQPRMRAVDERIVCSMLLDDRQCESRAALAD
jgi:hypothetical protein